MSQHKTTFSLMTLLLGLLLLAPMGLLGQQKSECTLRLSDATKNFEAGQLDEVLDLLLDCIKKSNFENNQDKINALRLVVKTYLYKDRQDRADFWAQEILITDPEYRPNPDLEPSEYLQIFDRYKALARFSIGIKGGVILSPVDVMQVHSVSTVSGDNGTYSLVPGANIGVILDIRLKNKLSATAELISNIKRIVYTNTIYPFTLLEYRETQSTLEIPLSLKYEFGSRKLTPFVRAGVSFGVQVNNSTKVKRTFPNEALQPIPELTTSMIEHRKQFEINPLAGIGANYKLGRASLIFEVRYRPYLGNLVKTDKRFADENLTYQYYYADDDFRLDNIEISFGVSYLIYKIYDQSKKAAKKQKVKAKKIKTVPKEAGS